MERVDFIDGNNVDNDYSRKMTIYEDEDGEGIEIHADFVAGGTNI